MIAPVTMPSRSRRSLVTASLAAALSVGSGGCVMSAFMPSVIEAPQIQARAVQFLGASGGTAAMRVELVGYNPNAFSLYAASLRAELSIAGRPMGTVDATFAQVLPARRPLVVLVEVNVSRIGSARALPTSAAQWEANASAVPFRIDGALLFRSRFGDVSVPWGFQGAVQSTVFANW
jgi:hypothetical protein